MVKCSHRNPKQVSVL